MYFEFKKKTNPNKQVSIVFTLDATGVGSRVLGSMTMGSCLQISVCLGEIGIHITKQGETIFANRMADLIRRALN